MTHRFSANTGFLWKGRPFLERIEAAAAAGFDAVEFHDEAQDADPEALARVLEREGLPVVGLNVRAGDTAGCAAIPGQEARTRAEFEAALEVARRCGAGAIHVMSGRTDDPRAEETLLANLDRLAGITDRTILIEPICAAAMPGYALHDVDQAAALIERLGRPEVRLLFDLYHVANSGHDLVAAFERHREAVGHVQIAAPSDRGEPTPDLAPVLARIRELGYDGPFGCEYRPRGSMAEGLAWRDAFADV